MESQPQNPEFRINPENFHPCIQKTVVPYSFVSFQGRGPCAPSLLIRACRKLTRIELLARDFFVFILHQKKMQDQNLDF